LGAEEAPAAGPGAATATSADTTPAAGKPGGAATTAAAPAPIAVDAAPAASAPIVETVHSAPPADAGAAQLAPNGASVSVSEASWIEAVDAGGRVLLSRTVLPGETITLDGTAPLRMRIGNARATRLSWRGATVDLNASARDNIARVDLK
jgi:cytoskeleton protein RodZ